MTHSFAKVNRDGVLRNSVALTTKEYNKDLDIRLKKLYGLLSLLYAFIGEAEKVTVITKAIKFVKQFVTVDDLKVLISAFAIGFANAVVMTAFDAEFKMKRFPMIPLLPLKRSVKSFKNSLFVVWDIETVGLGQAINNYKPEVPVMTGWVISNKGQMTEGFSHNYKVGDPTSVNQGNYKMIKDMLQSVIDYVLANKCESILNKNTIYMYAHNGGSFDLKIMLKALYQIHKENSNEMPVHISDKNHDIYQITIKFGGFTFVFRDSMKLLLSSVANLNDGMLNGKFPKIPCNLDVFDKLVADKLMENYNPALTETLFNKDSRYGVVKDWEQYKGKYNTPHSYIMKYCIMDCHIVAEALIKFSNVIAKEMKFAIDIKECITISSMAMYVFTHKFSSPKTPILSINITSSIFKFISKAYIGGRVEVFNSGKGYDKVYHFDVPGMYALCMKKDLPIGNPIYITDFKGDMDSSKFLSELHNKGFIGFFKVKATCPTTLSIPVLGVHSESGKLYFPQGNVHGTWSSHELELAVRIGYTLTFIEGYVFKSGNPLKAYSELFTRIKDKSEQMGDKPTRTIAKLFLNSLYGKFASHYFTDTSMVVYNDEDIKIIARLFDINSVIDLDKDMKIVNFKLNVVKSQNVSVDKDTLKRAYNKCDQILKDKNVNMGIAAAITAHGRIMLYNLYLEVEKIGGVLMYSDTDSVFAWLPEAPFGKPFGPFIWTGKPESETSKEFVFIAPKMYYFKSEDGKLKFKVKGVSTASSKYNHLDLMKVLEEKGKITFTNQKTFNNLPLKMGAGIIVKEGLSKTYNMMDSKRKWMSDGVYLWTEPFVVNLIDKEISKPETPMVYRETLLKAIIDQPLSEVKVVSNSNDIPITPNSFQNINPDYNSFTINMDTNKMDEEFDIVWSHIIATAKYNTNNFENVRKIKRFQVIVLDTEQMKYYTIIFNNGFKWIGTPMNEMKKLIIDMIMKAESGYDNTFNFNRIKLSVWYETMPKIICVPNQVTIDQMKVEFQNIKSIPRTESIKSEILNKQEELKLAEKVADKLHGTLSYLAQQDRAIIKDFEKRIPEILIQEGIFKNADIDYLIDLSTKDRSTENLVEEIQVAVSRIMVTAMWKRMIDEGAVNPHKIKEYLVKELGILLTDERGIKAAIYLSWVILLTLQKVGILQIGSMGRRFYDKEHQEFYYTQVSYSFARNFTDLNNVINLLHVLTKISFVPVKHPYDPSSIDPSVASKDKSDQLTKMNSVKVMFNNIYLVKIVEKFNSYVEEAEKVETKKEQWPFKKAFADWIGWTTKNEIESGMNEMFVVINTINTIKDLIIKIDTQFYYNIHFCDDRGRVYTKLTNVSHIAHKWLRPAFALEGSEVYLSWLPSLSLNSTNPFKNADYFFNIAEEFGFNLTIETTIEQILSNLESLITDKLNPRLLARIQEIKVLIENGYIYCSIPIQLDMKNNALQHIATICDDQDIMKMVGVLASDSNVIDLYETVGMKVYNIYKQNSHQDWAEDLLSKLIHENDDEANIKIIRKIVKRVVITVAYSATDHRMMTYVYDRLKELNVKMRYTNKRMLAKIIVSITKETLFKEIDLMNSFKQAFISKDGTINWSTVLSDFKVKTQYILSEEKDLKISFKGENHHTKYKVYFNTPNQAKIRRATFVNIIHSLDALNLILFILEWDKFNMFAIHDALLVNWNEDFNKVINKMVEKFILIHNEGKVINKIAQDLSNRAGVKLVYISNVKLSPKISGTMMNKF